MGNRVGAYDMETFGARMRALMVDRGVSLRGLARTVHYDVGLLSKVSRDLKVPSPEVAHVLDAALAADGQLVALVPARTSPGSRRADSDTSGGITSDEEERLRLALQRPARLDRKVIESLATVLASQRRVEDVMGPASLVVPMRAQLDRLTAMLRDASGPLRTDLGRLVAEWTVFTGWLHAAVRFDDRAFTLWDQAVELADDFEHGTMAAQACSFRGYVARRAGRYPAVVRASCAAVATPGSHETQRIFDTLQAAHGYAALGEREHARRLIDGAAARAMDAPEPPPPVYWYTPPFFQIYIGAVLVDFGAYGDAADLLRSGMEGMPEEQRGAEWMAEYRDALTIAQDRA